MNRRRSRSSAVAAAAFFPAPVTARSATPAATPESYRSAGTSPLPSSPARSPTPSAAPLFSNISCLIRTLMPSSPVSCPEDLDNMMEEYDKLADSSPDGSAKLRAFLFFPSDSDGTPLEAGDSGQRYIEAVNGIGRRDSGASATSVTSATSAASSTHNSDAYLATADFATTEGNSPTLDLKSAYQEPASIHYGHPQPPPELAGVPTHSFVPVRPLQPLSQLPPLPPSYLKPMVPAPAAQGQTMRLDDCYMCQRALPHAHSDTLIPEKANVSSSSAPGSSFPEANSVFYSHHSEDMMRAHRTVVGDNVVDARAENAVLEYGLVAGTNVPRMHLDDQLQQQQVRGQTLIPPQLYPVKQDGIPRPLGIDASSTRNANFQTAESSNLNLFPEGANDYVRPVDGMMEGLRLSPTEAARYGEQGKPVVRPNYVAPKDGKPDTLPMVVENSHTYGGTGVQVTNSFTNPGVLETNGVIPVNQLPPIPYSAPYLHSLQPSEICNASMVANQIPYSHHLEPGHEPPIPSDRLLGVPSYACPTDTAYNNHAINHKIAVGDWRGEPSGVHLQNAVSHMPAPLDGNIPSNLVSTINPAGLVDYIQEPLPSDSLFSNHDPWNVVGGKHLLPPRGFRVDGKEPIAARDLSVESFVRNTADSNIVVLLEEGALHQQLDPVVKDLHSRICSIHKRKPGAKQLDKVNIGIQITEDIGRLQIIKNSDLEELKELGSGTFGTVYHGKWRGSDVAIKRINDRCFAGKPSEQERMRADFWNEACKLADLHHPSVLAFYGVVLDGPGDSIRDTFSRTLDHRKRLLIAMDVAFGMEYLHGKNIVHFDLKSDNLLINLRDPQRPICKATDSQFSCPDLELIIVGHVILH
ncbi:hypothetical protein J5N97_003189 [Dioscorea zingiberensis]|uniref:Protein kinase domain-containing protein n=1 Tax=Dioscorea zingiberensis TaxID=325984 RepID=A0A9D5D668_9LILI|nr:hypothetical protein J5N97_003189 [Dioscorea zingiberensis]